MAATANGSMPQAVQSGALTPASAVAAIEVLRVSPPGSRLQKSSGASARRVICACRAVVPSAPDPVPDVASATAAKNEGAFTVLERLPAVELSSTDPKLYRLATPLASLMDWLAAEAALSSEDAVPINCEAAANAMELAAWLSSPRIRYRRPRSSAKP